MFPGLELCCADPARHLATAGEELDYLDHGLSDLANELDDLDHDLSDLSVPGVKGLCCTPSGFETGHFDQNK